MIFKTLLALTLVSYLAVGVALAFVLAALVGGKLAALLVGSVVALVITTSLVAATWSEG